MLNPTQTSWVILAGGQASRMGGKDKGLIELNNKPLIQHVIERLSPQTPIILINANRNQQAYAQFGQVFSDHFSDYPGPMGGIHAVWFTLKPIGLVLCRVTARRSARIWLSAFATK